MRKKEGLISELYLPAMVGETGCHAVRIPQAQPDPLAGPCQGTWLEAVIHKCHPSSALTRLTPECP